MLEALWSVEFVTSAQTGGAGVIVLESSRAFGGDSFYYYIGRYELVHDILKAEVKVTHYSGPMASVFGPFKELNYKLEGKIGEPSFMLRGHVVGQPEKQITVRLTKRADLP